MNLYKPNLSLTQNVVSFHIQLLIQVLRST